MIFAGIFSARQTSAFSFRPDLDGLFLFSRGFRRSELSARKVVGSMRLVVELLSDPVSALDSIVG